MLNRTLQILVLAAIGVVAYAEPHPVKPICLIVPYAPGGGVDIVAGRAS